MNGSLTTGLPMTDYLAIDACSSGAAKALANASPHAWRNKVQTSSAAQSLGTAAHVAILEADTFWGRYIIQPPADLRTNAGKEILVAWLVAAVGEPTVRPPPKAAVGTTLDLYIAELRPRLEATGMTVLTEAERDAVSGMFCAVMSRPHTRALIEAAGAVEITGRLLDEEFQIPIKVRPDKLLEGSPIVVSLKTCQSVADREYLRTAWSYGYHGAAWFYCRALEGITGEPHRYWELAVESAPPHDVLLLEYTDREIREGEAMMRRGMDQYRRCTEAGIWPGAGWDWVLGDYTIRPIGRQQETY
jgi:hypothetical protein